MAPEGGQDDGASEVRDGALRAIGSGAGWCIVTAEPEAVLMRNQTAPRLRVYGTDPPVAPGARSCGATKKGDCHEPACRNGCHVIGDAVGIGRACVERIAGEGAAGAIFDVMEAEGSALAADLAVRGIGWRSGVWM